MILEHWDDWSCIDKTQYISKELERRPQKSNRKTAIPELFAAHHLSLCLLLLLACSQAASWAVPAAGKTSSLSARCVPSRLLLIDCVLLLLLLSSPFSLSIELVQDLSSGGWYPNPDGSASMSFHTDDPTAVSIAQGARPRFWYLAFARCGAQGTGTRTQNEKQKKKKKKKKNAKDVSTDAEFRGFCYLICFQVSVVLSTSFTFFRLLKAAGITNLVQMSTV
jgi:hypothetical protein